MEIQYLGANCVRLSSKKVTIVVDDNLAELGQKTAIKKGEIALFTHPHEAPAAEPKIVIDQPGEYEVSDTSIKGIAVRAHTDEEGKSSATMFKIVEDDLNIVVTGHIYPDLSDEQLEALGMVDILIVPVGGNGYTLDGVGAQKVVRKIGPKIVVPTHYDQTGFKFPVPQQPLAEALKALGMEASETLPKLKVKHGELTEVTKLVVLEK